MINKEQYSHIANLIAEIQDLGDLSLLPLVCVRDTLFNADINPRERYRREFFALLDATYSFLATNHSVPNQPLQNVVSSLNRHVLEKYEYDDINEFLDAENITVPKSFADISKYVGYPINSYSTESQGTNWENILDLWTLQDYYWEIWGG
jgi:hypothetical protein